MKKKSLIFCAFVISNSCYATNYADTTISISPSLLHFDYTEFNTSGKVLDRELGWLSGIEIELNHTITTDWFIKVFSSYYQGTVDYDGQTQQGEPHRTDTRTNLFRYGARIEKNIFQKTRLFTGAQIHHWERDIKDNNNVSGLDETYDWIEYSIGFNTDILTYQYNSFNIEVAYLLIRNATIDVDLSRVGAGSATLDIGDDDGGRLNISWNRISENNFHYGASLFVEAWNFKRSNTKRTQGGALNVFVTEPKSETRNIGLKFNIGYSF